jgi:hypothetical protein
MALQGVPTLAQFMPYQADSQQGYNQNQAGPKTPQYAPQAYAQQPYTQQYTQSQQSYAQPQYTAMAFQESRPANMPAEAVNPGNLMQPSPAPMSYDNSQAGNYQSSGYPSNDYQAGGYQSGGCATGNCGGGYNTFDSGCGVTGSYGGCNTGCNTGCDLGCCSQGCGGRRWFGGIYGLFMERAGNDWVPMGFAVDDATPYGYYPEQQDYVLNYDQVSSTSHAGAEIRLGFVLGGGNCGCGPRYALEAAYWGLAQEENSASYDVQVGDRLYGLVDYRGLQYDNGYIAGYRPVNHYYDYAPPTSDYATGWNDTAVQRLTVRSAFSMQNVEVNLLRLPLLSGGCATGCCDTGCGGCDSGMCGVNPSVGRGCCGSRCSVTTLVGVRYLRIDEDFSLTSDYIEDVGGGDYVDAITHSVEADNHLIGLQLGTNGTYQLGCAGRWALHCNANAGIYANHMSVNQSFDGDVQYLNGDDFAVATEDDDVAMVAELRAGMSYQFCCNWRLYSGYRALGVSGVALSYDQIPSNFSSPEQTNYVDSSGSLFVHGLQAGLEWTY